MLVGWQGNSYVEGLVSEAECSKKLQELKSGMTKAFEYSQGKIKFYCCICTYVQYKRDSVVLVRLIGNSIKCP